MVLGSPSPLSSHVLMDPETTISTLLMHDHYNYDLFAENCVTFGSKNKKKDAYELDLEGSPNIT